MYFLRRPFRIVAFALLYGNCNLGRTSLDLLSPSLARSRLVLDEMKIPLLLARVFKNCPICCLRFAIWNTRFNIRKSKTLPAFEPPSLAEVQEAPDPGAQAPLPWQKEVRALHGRLQVHEQRRHGTQGMRSWEFRVHVSSLQKNVTSGSTNFEGYPVDRRNVGAFGLLKCLPFSPSLSCTEVQSSRGVAAPEEGGHHGRVPGAEQEKPSRARAALGLVLHREREQRGEAAHRERCERFAEVAAGSQSARRRSRGSRCYTKHSRKLHKSLSQEIAASTVLLPVRPLHFYPGRHVQLNLHLGVLRVRTPFPMLLPPPGNRKANIQAFEKFVQRRYLAVEQSTIHNNFLSWPERTRDLVKNKGGAIRY